MEYVVLQNFQILMLMIIAQNLSVWFKSKFICNERQFVWCESIWIVINCYVLLHRNKYSNPIRILFWVQSIFKYESYTEYRKLKQDDKLVPRFDGMNELKGLVQWIHHRSKQVSKHNLNIEFYQNWRVHTF